MDLGRSRIPLLSRNGHTINVVKEWKFVKEKKRMDCEKEQRQNCCDGIMLLLTWNSQQNHSQQGTF